MSVTWQNNGQSSYNGKTHKILRDSLEDLPFEMKEGLEVTVYWPSGKRKFCNAVIASSQKGCANPAAAAVTSSQETVPSQKKSAKQVKLATNANGGKPTRNKVSAKS